MPSLYFTSLKKRGFAVDLKGRSGHGKTYTIEMFPIVMKALFLDKNYGLVVIEGASLNPSNAQGYMWPEDTAFGKASFFTNPYWMYTREGKHISEYDGGIILVDDWHLIDRDMKKYLSQGAYEGHLANHDFRKFNWVMWFAGNRPEDRAGATADFDHTINRQDRVDISDDPEGMVQSLKDLGCMPVTWEWAEKFNQKYIYVPPPAVQGPFCTPRSLAASDSFLQIQKELYEMEEVPCDANIMEFVTGSLGKAAGNEYITYIREYNALPPYAEIIKNPREVKMPPEDRPDLWRLQAYNLAHDVQVKHGNQAILYMSRFPREFQTVFVRAAIANSSRIMFEPKFREWMSQNSAMIAALSGLEEAAE